MRSFFREIREKRNIKKAYNELNSFLCQMAEDAMTHDDKMRNPSSEEPIEDWISLACSHCSNKFNFVGTGAFFTNKMFLIVWRKKCSIPKEQKKIDRILRQLTEDSDKYLSPYKKRVLVNPNIRKAVSKMRELLGFSDIFYEEKNLKKIYKLLRYIGDNTSLRDNDCVVLFLHDIYFFYFYYYHTYATYDELQYFQNPNLFKKEKERVFFLNELEGLVDKVSRFPPEKSFRDLLMEIYEDCKDSL